MINQAIFDEISNKISQVLANSPAKDFEKNIKALLTATFSRLDLVTREEFDVQQAVLAKTREKLTQLEARLASLEAQVLPTETVGNTRSAEDNLSIQ